MISVWAKSFAILQIFSSYPMAPSYTPEYCVPFSKDAGGGYVAQMSGLDHDVFVGIVTDAATDLDKGSKGCFSPPDILYQWKDR